MSYYRSYFEKNNTIIKGSSINTARNPNTEIIYGNTFSKFLFKIDLSQLKEKVDNGEYVIDNNTKHILHLTNTIFGDEALLGDDRGNTNKRATSFDLILFRIDEFWDEGVGFDYEKTYDSATGQQLFDTRPSNWFNRTTLNTWNEEGIYSTGVTIIKTIHFDLGNEDIDVDITDYINDILYGLQTNYGFGLAFSTPYQDVSTDVGQSVAFFSKYTQTFFEPYLESYFNDEIKDDRLNFTHGVNQNLYLYVTKGSNFYDLDQLPSVDILDNTKTPIPGLTNLLPTKVRKGVYRITFIIEGTLCDGTKFFYDKWKSLKIDGSTINDVTQKFIPKSFTSQYTIGQNPTELQRYSIQYFGVKLNEKIKRGEKRKIVVTFRSIDIQKPVLLDEVFYRIYIKEGRTQVNVFNWTKLDKTNENSFFLDTSYMIPREYYLEIKGKTHTEEIFYKESINFEIVSEKMGNTVASIENTETNSGGGNGGGGNGGGGNGGGGNGGGGPLFIGKNYAGGKIAYLDETGEHGFVVNMVTTFSSMLNQGIWGPNDKFIGVTSTDIGDAGINTDTMMSELVGVQNVCVYYVTNDSTNGYTDWKLPTLDEMIQIYSVNNIINRYGIRWTSSEIDEGTAYSFNMYNGTYGPQNKTIPNYFLGIRYF